MGMNCFKQNSCRICRKVFCCPNCRAMHEQNVHKIHPKCDICIYGQTFFKNPSPDLIEHVKNKHWPLHCVHCDRTFGSMEEIFVHSKCPAGKKKAGDTPENKKENYKFSTPPVFAQIIIKQGINSVMYENQICITTSTPVPRNEKDIVQIISEVITPVDNPESKEIVDIKKQTNKSAMTPILCDSKKSEHSKRKVTFSENIHECIDESSNENISTTPGRYENGQGSNLHTHDSEVELFYTAHGEIVDLDEEMEQTENDKNEEAIKQSQSQREQFETTLWESAITHQMDLSDNANLEMVIAQNQIVPAISCVCTVRKDDPQPNKTSSIAKMATITYFVQPIRERTHSEGSDFSDDFSEKSTGIWSSMANIFKNVFQGLSGSNSSYNEHSKLLGKADMLYVSQKRPKPDIDDDSGHSPVIKKMKFTDIKCRRPIRNIRNIRPLLQLGYPRRRVTYAHKLTQTD